MKQTEIGLIPEDWEVKEIDSFCSKITSGGTPSRTNKLFWENGKIPWLKTKELLDNDIFSTEEFITEKGLKGSSAKIFPKNTVIMAMYGATVGKLGISQIELTTNQACCAMIVDYDKSTPRFLFYNLLLNRNKLINLSTGAAQQNLNQDTIRFFKLPFPPLQEQSSIAKILSGLDSKIELLQKQNETLEKIGQAIFKQWFVDFEFPNEEGKPYKSSGGEMIESELGEIPKDWSVGKLGDKLKTVLGGTPSKSKPEYWEGNIPWINSGAINDFPVMNFSKTISELGLKNSAAKLMPKGTVVLPFVISVGKEVRISVLGIESSGNQSVLGILENEEYSSEFIYNWIQLRK